MRTTRAGTRLLGLARVARAVVLLTERDRSWTALTARPPTATERATIVVVGVRELVQGLAQVVVPDRLRWPWLVVARAHAGSMVLLAAHRPSVRRPALVSAGMAAGSAGAELALVRGDR
jgi:hypothetical protein